MQTYYRACGPCGVRNHEQCITVVTPEQAAEGIEPGLCGCEATDHRALDHPAFGEVYREERGPRFGPMRDVDYDLEPYEVYTNNEANVSKSKPRDDLEAAREVQNKYYERQMYGQF
jgi:hypothetical protein